MKTVTLILPLEATTVSDSRSNRSSDTVATADATAAATERQKRQRIDNGATMAQQQSDIRGDSRSDCVAIEGATTEERQWSDSGATA